MILSHKQIEEIAAGVMQDFFKFFFGDDFDEGKRFALCTPIDQFAKDFLGLSVSFAKLSTDGSICGLTAYTDTEYETEDMGIKRIIPLKQNQVLLDESFIQPGQIKKLCGKRRFTLAHECAHQILYQYESDDDKVACRKKYAARSSYSLRELKTREDWNEWQANALGAAILMPQKEIDLAMWYFSHGKKLIDYEGRFAYRDRLTLKMLCQHFGISMSAAIIRLRELDHLEDRPYLDYHDPLEVWA